MPTPDVSRLSNTLTDGVTIYQQVVYTTQDLASGFIERIPYFVAALIVLGIFWLLSIIFKKVVHKTLGARVRHQNLVKVFQRIGGAIGSHVFGDASLHGDNKVYGFLVPDNNIIGGIDSDIF